MSLKNIVHREVKDGREHITFKTDTHEHTYSFDKRQQKSLKNGADPSDLKGRLEKSKKL
jgi:hypothetical protein